MLGFQEELKKYLDIIDSGKNISIVRYGDGEKMLMCNQAFTGQALIQDKRQSNGVETKLGNDIKKALDVDDENYIYGIPCQCCNNECKKWFLDNIKTKNLTFANLFINGNYKVFTNRIENTDKGFYVIANKEGWAKKYPFKILGYYPLDDDCVNWYEKNKGRYLKLLVKLAKDNNNQIFLFAGGPLSKIFIYKMYKANPNNTYLDIGSGLDIYTKGRITRGYVRLGDYYSNRICTF